MKTAVMFEDKMRHLNSVNSVRTAIILNRKDTCGTVMIEFGL